MYEVRKQRLAQLITERFEGSQKDFADAVEKAPAQIAHYLRGNRNLGEAVAREIEKKLDLSPGWLDGIEQQPGAQLTSDVVALQRKISTLEKQLEESRAVISQLVRIAAEGEAVLRGAKIVEVAESKTVQRRSPRYQEAPPGVAAHGDYGYPSLPSQKTRNKRAS